jgi:hypothetical protein
MHVYLPDLTITPEEFALAFDKQYHSRKAN